MDATMLLLSADCPAASAGRLSAWPRVAYAGPCPRLRSSVRASAELRVSVRPSVAAAAPAARGLPHHASVAGQSSGIYTVGDFMTKREELHVVKPTTSVDEALEMLVEHRITGFPVIDSDWNLATEGPEQTEAETKVEGDTDNESAALAAEQDQDDT
ncbi:hypothetical protein ACP70R_049050 [Stipagrostis hirtigluma subsp. patula]